MVGKASLFVVAGFSILFLVVVQNFGEITNRAVDNFVDYHAETIAHNIAVSGANLAASNVYFDPLWTEGYSNKPFHNGKLNVDVQYNTVFKTHTIKSTGKYLDHTKTVTITLAPNSFSYFSYFSVWEKASSSSNQLIWWTWADTVWGPFHTQDNLTVKGRPTFFGQSTSHKGALLLYDYYNYYPNQIPQKPTNNTQRNRYNASWNADKPTITGDYKPGFSIEIPAGSVDNIEAAADDAGYKFTGQDTVYLKFNRDSLHYKFSYSSNYSSLYLPSAAPNGVIFAKNSVVRLQGTVKGAYTIACSSPGSGTGANPNKGNIYLDGDIVYDKDPRQNPGSSDMLGICAENYVWITENSANSNDINIHGSIFCENGGFGAQNYNTRPVNGDINLLGGVIQYYRQPVGTFSGSSINHGFTKQYKYDERFLTASPPFFPGTNGFRIVSWLE